MSGYLVLARKYRPKTFADVLGQEVVTGVLRGALAEGRVAHAYLFSGPRGTGKTTTARILARCLNCVKGPTADPCGVCTHCMGIDAGNDPDLIEIDAATHTGVDHIRELREQTAYAPMKARYKVYIVDEVHMLSKPAFNALLKTLEEPPPHVVFLFATTELHKVLPTIVSRCQVLKLGALSEAAIVGGLRDVLRREGVTPGPGVLEEVARAASGGMRDALSLIDKLLALAGSEPTLDDLTRLGGHVGARELEDLLGCVEAGDKGGVLAALARFEGGEPELVGALLGHLRLSLLAAFCGAESPLLPADARERAPILARAERLNGERVELWMQELLHARERMRDLPGQERLVLELTLLDLARPETTMPLAELEARLRALDADVPAASAPPPAAPRAALPKSAPPVAPAAVPAPAPQRAGGSGASASDASGNVWTTALDALAATHGALASLLRDRARFDLRDDAFELALPPLGEADRAMVSDRRGRAALRRALERATGRSLELTVTEEGRKDAGSAPAERKPAAPKDDFTQQVADLFGGVIEDLS